MNLTRHHHATNRLIGVALLALLLGQWAVLAHSVSHAQRPAIAAVAVSDHGYDPHHDHDHHDAWGHEAGTPACQLLDHLLVGQAAGNKATPLLWPTPPAALLAAPAPSVTPGPAWRGVEARGPPWA